MIHSNPRIVCDTHAAVTAQRTGSWGGLWVEGDSGPESKGWVRVLQADEEEGRRKKEPRQRLGGTVGCGQ